MTDLAIRLPARAVLAVLLVLFCHAVSAAPGEGESESVPPGSGEISVGGRISGEARLAGRVRVTEDLLVLPGATLTVSPGTMITFAKSESTKVDPEFFHGGTELVVRGTLRAAGARFLFPGRTGGIAVDGGAAVLSDVRVSGAETGIAVLGKGSVAADGRVEIADCRVGISLFPGSREAWKGAGGVELTGNGIAVVLFPGAPSLPGTFRPRGSEEKDVVAWGDAYDPGCAGVPANPVPSPGALRLGDTFVDRSRVLSGDVVVEGVVRVAPGATLTIAPGSRIFFGFRDTDGDGIGENGIFLQGNLDARGAGDRPIGFYPLNGEGWGRWDSINFMASDRGENFLENVVIAGAYRGLHAHFSRLRGKGIRIARCYRGIQFQESDVDLSEVEVVSSQSAVRCRDSDVKMAGLKIRDTASGGNFFRSRVTLAAPDLSRPGWYGFRFRECRADLSGGTIRESLVNLSVQDGKVRAVNVSLDSAGLAGFALQEGDVTMEGCRISGSGLDAVSATAGKVLIAGGTLSSFGRYAVKLTGPAEVSLSGVEVDGRGGAANPFHDGKTVKGLGVVRVE